MFYWYYPPQYWDYTAFNERVNLSILRRFNEEGIEFAFPTQTIHLANNAGESRRHESASSAIKPPVGRE